MSTKPADPAVTYHMVTVDSKTRVSVGATSTLILAANANRTHATIQASSDNSEPIWLGWSEAAVINDGICLYPGQHYEIMKDFKFLGALYGITASGGMYAHVLEAE
jgi:hypothetical protein